MNPWRLSEENRDRPVAFLLPQVHRAQLRVAIRPPGGRRPVGRQGGNFRDLINYYYKLVVEKLSPVHSVWCEHPNVLAMPRVDELVKRGTERTHEPNCYVCQRQAYR
jgi:hypothetical protein